MDLASRLCELIDELAESYQCLYADTWLQAQHHRGASDFIEHPDRDHDSQFRLVGGLVAPLDPHQHCGVSAIASPSQDGHIVIKERVKTVSDSRRTELAGSVWIHCDTHLRPNFWKRASICGPSRRFWGTAIFGPLCCTPMSAAITCSRRLGW